MLFVDCEDEAIFFQCEFILRYRSKSHTLNQIPHTGRVFESVYIHPPIDSFIISTARGNKKNTLENMAIINFLTWDLTLLH